MQNQPQNQLQNQQKPNENSKEEEHYSANKEVQKVQEVPKVSGIQSDEEEEFLDEDEEANAKETPNETPKIVEKTVVMPPKEVTEAKKESSQVENAEELSKEQQIAYEIEVLQNNGRYRVELLHQLQEINRALTVIAGVLVEKAGNGKNL